MTNYLIPALFPIECGNTRRLSMSSQRQLQVPVGISSLPKDMYIIDLSCTNMANTSDSCFVFRGEVTVYTVNRRLVESAIIVQRSIQNGIENDQFISSDPRIRRMAYMNLSALGSGISSDSSAPIQASGRGPNNLVLGFVVALVGTAMIALGSFIAYRRRRRNLMEEWNHISNPPSENVNSVMEAEGEERTVHVAAVSSQETSQADIQDCATESTNALENKGLLLDTAQGSTHGPDFEYLSPTDSSVYLDPELEELALGTGKKSTTHFI